MAELVAVQTDADQVTVRLARLEELIGQFSQSRVRIEDFASELLTDLNKLRREISYQELKWNKSRNS